MAKNKSGSSLSAPKVDLSQFGYLGGGDNKSGGSKSGPSTSGTDIDDPVGNIARIPDTTPYSSSTVSTEVRENYTPGDEDEELGRHAGRQAAIDSSYTDDQAEWARRYPYWDWNLAKNNPRGNLNGMTFRDTRLYSRLADALNNERHLKPTDIGRRTLNYGATGTGADQAGSERWEPIETQEMRQMRANERLDEKARGYDIDRQKAIEDYPLELRKQMDKLNMDLAKYVSQSNIDVEKFMKEGIFDSKYKGSWSTYWNTLQHRFAVELGQDMKERVFSKLTKLGYIAGALYSSGMGFQAPPTQIMKALYDTIDEAIYNEPDPTVRFYRVMALYGMFGGGLLGAAGSMMFSGLGIGG